eukprot:746220-Prorocentrum_minimum.AAC.1
MEDWQIDPSVVSYLERQFGPFDVDECVDEFRTDSHCINSWNEHDNCLVQNWAASPRGTEAVFILPCWTQESFYKLFSAHPNVWWVVRRWPTDTPLFTAPIPAGLGGGRRFVETTNRPVIAVRADPM